MIDPLQQTEQALHITTPFVQRVIRITGFREIHDPCWTVDLRIYCLGGDEVADILLGILLIQVEEFGEAAHLDTGIVSGDHADVVLDDAFA